MLRLFGDFVFVNGFAVFDSFVNLLSFLCKPVKVVLVTGNKFSFVVFEK